MGFGSEIPLVLEQERSAGPRGPQDAPWPGRPRRFSPPAARVDTVSIASSEPSDYGCTATRWSLDDIAATIFNQAHAEVMSRSTIFRILDDADLRPHRSTYWLNSHAPDFQAKVCEAVASLSNVAFDPPQKSKRGAQRREFLTDFFSVGCNNTTSALLCRTIDRIVLSSDSHTKNWHDPLQATDRKFNSANKNDFTMRR